MQMASGLGRAAHLHQRIHETFMHPLRTLLIALASAVLISACATTVDQTGSTEPLARPSAQAEKQVVLTLKRTDTEQSAEDWAAFKSEWQDALGNIAQEHGASLKMAEEGNARITENAVLIKGMVKAFRYVSPGKRMAFGVMTGNAYMDIRFEFIEMPAGRALGTRRYSTSSSTMQGIFSPMTDRQVRATADTLWRDLFE